MRLLFISHTYPPVKGGIENQNYYLAEGLKKLTKTKIIANGRGKWFLPFFLPWVFFRCLIEMAFCDVCLLGSGVLSPVGSFLRFFYPRKKFFSIIHGLDITYSNQKGLLSRIYKRINIPSLRRMHRLFAVGNATVEEAVKAGIKREKIIFIPNGVHVDELLEKHSKKELEKLTGFRNLDQKIVILRLARFVPHKGTSWFIGNVMPKLSENIVMVAAGNRVGRSSAGNKDDFPNCESMIAQNNLQDRVVLLQSLSKEEVKILLNTADIVVSPNIKIHGTMEGFGINVIEAAACERVVVASDLEGLRDAVKNGKNGFLAKAGNADHWIKKIEALVEAGGSFRKNFGIRARKFVEKNFSWDKICQIYLDKMKEV